MAMMRMWIVRAASTIAVKGNGAVAVVAAIEGENAWTRAHGPTQDLDDEGGVETTIEIPDPTETIAMNDGAIAVTPRGKTTEVAHLRGVAAVEVGADGEASCATVKRVRVAIREVQEGRRTQHHLWAGVNAKQALKLTKVVLQSSLLGLPKSQ